jgi:hypothetical protein
MNNIVKELDSIFKKLKHLKNVNNPHFIIDTHYIDKFPKYIFDYFDKVI